MFTGLVEEAGIVERITKGTKSAKITIKAHKVLDNLKLGDSISTNGVCLTVVDFNKCTFSVDVMAETIRRSNLKNLSVGSSVNLERALQLSSRLGGHIVSGHIDGVGTITCYKNEDNAIWITINTSAELLKYIVEKGSIAIDGVSLTVAYVDNKTFKVSIIPHTKEVTSLLKNNIGDEVNLECDIVGKYVEKFLLKKEDSSLSQSKGIDLEFLSSNGFM
ncbi:riboflavin synthase [Clostridium pasteurianum DSM 525 = ATCC 6013]|uniref:Riboflavin synthase n=1 Tax=Clostridium pasteurianum DSM 525 = ATCC 6013 TaxID=1262449 RepID=A0A0H3IYZ4_CLOPA|nr:riboflavin synthase [Clostridium pasteurianum]AJA46249.1 riboflavin synthase [Clostridium pasteurianum DSM 525 = ATCC 6013]AJA50237.1 riboflavin synthase [Clostridium pasteurianum DSM 525 = ATCC 6013]AOZ73702.1 riboflavin synthase subunit alpha [Clostridium pasteurianum DSM 525 = ATCC 6013]AOZ77499.1 riboflavin synthase subunit alpha [Clostridium pasteurianum]ELP60833.1 riboflavin synthase subunit alpha [Clostridium pasteurianum DSM 525 = ATCC 6013]